MFKVNTMDGYQLGKDIQEIKTRLEKIEAAFSSRVNGQPSIQELLDWKSGHFPGLDDFIIGGQLLIGLKEEADTAERQGRNDDANRIRGIRDIIATAPGKVDSGHASEISRDVAKGDFDNAEKTARDAVGGRGG